MTAQTATTEALDLDGPAEPQAVAQIAAVEGILSLRVV